VTVGCYEMVTLPTEERAGQALEPVWRLWSKDPFFLC